MRALFDVDAISIHSLRMEGDPVICGFHNNAVRISIHSLRMEGDTMADTTTIKDLVFQSTPSAWRETSAHHSANQKSNCISIHSLRMEGDIVPTAA